jgi:putative cardiolipin synthase
MKKTLMPSGTGCEGSTAHCSRLRRLAWATGTAMLVALQGCASLSPVDKAPSVAIPASTQEFLGRIAAQSMPAGESTGFRALPMSAYSMDARLSLARKAQKTLDLQYYLLQNDATGRTLMRAVRDAAERGVRVRLLVDDLYTVDSARMLRDLAAYRNVEVRLFNPFPAGRGLMLTRWAFSLFDFARVNHRMHNKMFIADGAFAVVGGRNIADEYFFRSAEGNFLDFDLLIAGRAVADLAAIFDEYWNSPRVYPIQALEMVSTKDSQALRDDFEQLLATDEPLYQAPPPGSRDILGYEALSSDLEHPPLQLLHGAVHVFADDPEKVTGRSETGQDQTTVTAHAMASFASAQTELLLASPYFVPGQLGMDALRETRRRGVKTTVMTNSLAANDEPFASAAYSRYRKAMLKIGVDIHEVSSRPPELARRYGNQIAAVGRSHAKIAVMDRRVTFVGSMNMDFRSSRKNTELGILVDSAALAGQVSGILEELMVTDAFSLSLEQPADQLRWTFVENGKTTCYDDEPDVSFARRLKIFLFAPLIPEEEL